MMLFFYRDIKIEFTDTDIKTNGLKKYQENELKVLNGGRQKNEYLELIKYIIDHNVKILDQETISFNSWALKFVKTQEYFLLWEAGIDGNGFKVGVEYALKITEEQKHQCKVNNVLAKFPNFSQNVVISKGVYEGLGVSAVRYPSPDHMCGWWITTDLYDGNIKSLMNVHFYHLAFTRPDLLKFMALPEGFRFYIENENAEVWYDEEVLSGK